MTLEEIGALFKAEVYDRSEEIDPQDFLDWNDLAYGFALGKGCTQEVGEELWRRWDTFCR